MLVFIITGQNRSHSMCIRNEFAGFKVDVESIVHVIGEIVETSKQN